MKKFIYVGVMLAILLVTVLAYANTFTHNKPGSIIPEPQVPIGDKIAYNQVYGVFLRNCSGCHNAETPGRNWLSQEEVEGKKATMYNRVFIRGDMPLFFKYFGGADRELLKQYLKQVDISN